MIRRGLLIGSLGFGTVLAGVMISAFATGNTTRPEVGTCAAYAGLPAEKGDTAGMAFIPGGTFQMGSERHQPEERFTHAVSVDGFWIDRHEVTNAQFKQFVEATGYRTLAERGLDPKAHPNMAKDLLTAGLGRFRPANGLEGRAAGSRSGGNMWPARTGANRPALAVQSPEKTIIRLCISPMRTLSPTPAGADATCRRRRNGSLPRAAAATARTIGRAPSMLAANRSRIPGRVSSRC